MLRRAIERRGEIDEAILSPWLAFEATDAITARLAAGAAPAALSEAIELVSSFCRRIADGVMAAGDLIQVEVRQALFAAGVEQIATLAQRAGVSVDPPEGVPGGRASALEVLDREHRRFDAARVRLWLAESGEPDADLSTAAAVFEELSAHPYLERSRRIGR